MNYDSAQTEKENADHDKNEDVVFNHGSNDAYGRIKDLIFGGF